MREVDRLTTERCSISGIQLMENAATRIVEAVLDQFGSVNDWHILVICGRGNNGGDGAAVARLLHNAGAIVDVALLGRLVDSSGDARVNFMAAGELATSEGRSFRFAEIETAQQLDEYFSGCYSLYVDAIFGTGLSRPATGLFKDAIEFLNLGSNNAPIVSVDIPSGISSDSAALIGPCVNADLTVTFTAPKLANVLPPASDHCGKLVVADIGSPGDLIQSIGSRLNLVDREWAARWLEASRRARHANKGDVGKVLIVAGSRGKTGAACLSGEAALRAGCGLVTIATAEGSQPVIASSAIPECMTEGLPETAGGSIALEASIRALELAAERDCVAVGPGLGSSDKSTRAFVRAIIDKRQQPIVIDADGLNSLAPWPAEISGSKKLPLVLTPHPGEMARLVSKQISDVLSDPIEQARSFAVTHKVIMVLKGSPTVIAAPDGEVYVNSTGNPGMATGGTGDVLTGMIASLIAQKPTDPVGASVAAVYLHGAAGDLAAKRLGTRAMVASDISKNLGDAFIEVGGDAEKFVP